MKKHLTKRYILAGLLAASFAEKAYAAQPGANKFQAAGQAVVAQNRLAAGVQAGMPARAAGVGVAAAAAVGAAQKMALPPLSAAEAAKKMKGALGEPLFIKTKCAKEYGNVKWADIKEIADRGYAPQIMAHFTKNATGCDPVKDKNFMDNMKKSCDAAGHITGFALKDQYCGAANKAAAIKAATIATVKAGANDNALFPSGPLMATFNNGMACPANAAAPLNTDGLSQYYVRHFATSTNAALIPQQRAIGIAAMKRADDYLAKLQKCSANKSDKNFNVALANKFPGATLPMHCATMYTPATLNNAPPIFVKKIQELCMSSKNTGTLIGNDNQVAAIKKAFNVPMTPLGYVNLPESLITPLTVPDAAQKIDVWSRLDAPSFDKHFNALWDGLTTKPGKVVNPKASAMMITACTTSLANSKNQKVLQLCNATKLTLQNNAAVQIKAALGANGKTFNCKAAMNINGASVINLLNANAAEGQAYLANVSGCLNNGDAMLAAQVLTACQAGLSGVADAGNLCALAEQKNAEAAAANNTLGGVVPADPSAAAVDLSAAAVDPSAVTFDEYGNPVDHSAIETDEYGNPVDQTLSNEPSTVGTEFTENTDPSMNLDPAADASGMGVDEYGNPIDTKNFHAEDAGQDMQFDENGNPIF